jgi:hypothetical protein
MRELGDVEGHNGANRNLSRTCRSCRSVPSACVVRFPILCVLVLGFGLSAALIAPVASASRVATVRLTARFTGYDRFAGPVLLKGRPVWGEHDADGRWRIYRAGARTAKLKTLPTGGGRSFYHPIDLSASGSSLAVVDSAFQVLDPQGGDYRTRVDRVLLGGVSKRFVQLAGCGYDTTTCEATPPCPPAFGFASWDASVGNGTAAWVSYCQGPTALQARKVAGGPLLLNLSLDLTFTPVVQQISAAGNFVAFLNDNKITVWDLATGEEAYRIPAPPGQLIARYAVQADGTVAVACSTNAVGANPPFALSWASPAHPSLQLLRGSPVGQLRLVNDRILFAEGPQFGPRRSLVLEQLPGGQRTVLTHFGAKHALANEGFTLDSSYALDAHHAAWATQLRAPLSGKHRAGPVMEVHAVPLPAISSHG